MSENKWISFLAKHGEWRTVNGHKYAIYGFTFATRPHRLLRFYGKHRFFKMSCTHLLLEQRNSREEHDISRSIPRSATFSQITLFPSFGRKVKQKKKKLPIIYYHSKATLFNHNTITFTKFTNIPNSSCSIPKKKKNKLFSPRIYYAWKISSPPRILPSQIKFPPIPGIRLNQEFVLLGEQNKISCFENRGTIERERKRERGEKERGGRKARVRQLAD